MQRGIHHEAYHQLLCCYEHSRSDRGGILPRDSISKAAQANLQMLTGLGLPEVIRCFEQLGEKQGCRLMDCWEQKRLWS